VTARFSVGGVLATSVRIWARNLPRFIWQVVWWGSFRLTDLAVFPDPSAGLAAYRHAETLYSIITLGRYVLLSSLELVMAAVAYRSLRDDKEGPAADALVTVFE